MDWSPRPLQLSPPGTCPSFFGLRSDDWIPVLKEWRVGLPSEEPRFPHNLSANGIYHTNAELVLSNPASIGCAYDFKGAQRWVEVGAQVLVAVNWRPDCVLAVRFAAAGVLPPALLRSAPLTFVGRQAAQWLENDSRVLGGLVRGGRRGNSDYRGPCAA